MTPLRTAARLGVALLVGVVVSACGFVVDARVGDRIDAVGPGQVDVVLDARQSSFEPEQVVVRPGTEVRFIVVNHDPIAHELIVGPPEVHERHEHGTEPEHPPVPGEVSVAPGETASTTYLFDEPGVVDFACHLPGHVAYGMVGQVTVTRT